MNCTDNYGCANELTVSIDGGAPTETTRDAFDTGELTEGRHQIRLWAHDQAGNKQMEPTVVTIEIDQTPPPKPTMVLVGGKETLEASINAEGTGSWQLEYQQAAATDCAPATFAPDPKWSGSLQKELVIGSSADPLPPRNYRLQVTLMDNVGNVARYTSETARVIGDALPRPTIMRLNASALNVSASVAVVDVQWSTDELFKPVNTKTRRNQVSPLVIDVPGRLVDAQVFVRVSEPGAESWSVPTKAWVTTETCLDTQYLEDTSPDPQSWQCQDCPEGAYCVGSVIWSDVVAKFGFWRVPGPAPQQFRACLLPSACLGAPNPDLYNRYYDGDREETKDLARFHWWNASGQPEACHEAWGFKQEMRRFHLPPLQHLSHRFQAQRTGRLHRVPRGGRQSCPAGPRHSRRFVRSGLHCVPLHSKGGGCGRGERGRQEDPAELPSSRQYCRPLPHAVARSRPVFL